MRRPTLLAIPMLRIALVVSAQQWVQSIPATANEKPNTYTNPVDSSCQLPAQAPFAGTAAADDILGPDDALSLTLVETR